MEPAVIVTIGAVVFAALTFRAVFRYIDPKIIEDDYKRCSGEWHEAYLNHCEAGLLRVPQQPVNTYSNLAYLAAGFYVELIVGTYPATVFLITMVYLCVGSTLYHATSTRWAGMLDVTAIYAVFSALAVYAAATLTGGTNALVALAMFVVAGPAVYTLSNRFRRQMQIVIGIFLGLTYTFLVIRMAISGEWSVWRILLLSFVLFALAYGCWMLDKAKKFPLERWGHGLWHVLTAAASALVFYGAYVLSL